MTRLAIGAIVALAALGGRPATAQMYCSAPSEPSCIGMMSFSRDQMSFDLCRSQVQSYRSETTSYLACLRRGQEEAMEQANEAIRRRNQAVQELNRVVERFNACARNDYC